MNRENGHNILASLGESTSRGASCMAFLSSGAAHRKFRMMMSAGGGARYSVGFHEGRKVVHGGYRKVTPEERARVFAMWKDGNTVTQICKELDRDYSHVVHMLRSGGIDARKSRLKKSARVEIEAALRGGESPISVAERLGKTRTYVHQINRDIIAERNAKEVQNG